MLATRLPDWLAKQSLSLEGKLRFQVYWLPTNASWSDQIEIRFSLLQRKLLPPNHFANTTQLQQAILDFSARYHQTAKPPRPPHNMLYVDGHSGMTNLLAILSAVLSTDHCKM
jgi:prepilin-type processing-associated H-X9-DG protein